VKPVTLARGPGGGSVSHSARRWRRELELGVGPVPRGWECGLWKMEYWVRGVGSLVCLGVPCVRGTEFLRRGGDFDPTAPMHRRHRHCTPWWVMDGGEEEPGPGPGGIGVGGGMVIWVAMRGWEVEWQKERTGETCWRGRSRFQGDLSY
jgi:hypothetical protein